jgi:hypothetical protein
MWHESYSQEEYLIVAHALGLQQYSLDDFFPCLESSVETKRLGTAGGPIRLCFDHGLGDCVNFAHLLSLHVQRGHKYEIQASKDKHILFAPLGIPCKEQLEWSEHVPWHDGGHIDEQNSDQYWLYNKAALNLNVAPLPEIGNRQELWRELADSKLDIIPSLPPRDIETISNYVAGLPRPLILLHTMGNTNQGIKSMPNDLVNDLYIRLLDQTSGTLILLDWDDRAPRFSSYRVRHIADDMHKFSTSELLALMSKADLLIGVDSGPLHSARYTNTPTIGFFPTEWHYPSRFCLPRGRQVNIVPSKMHAFNRKTRIEFNILECPGNGITSEFIAETSLKMLAHPKYLNQAHLGADVVLQQFIQWERGGANFLNGFTDRHHGFDTLFRTISERFVNPFVVETGCIRAHEDWSGAGFGTYLVGAFLRCFGGRLISVDIDRRNCDFARETTRQLGVVDVVCKDSVEFFRNLEQCVDVLILDSVDTDHPGAADHALNEMKTAYQQLHSGSVVVLDDTVYSHQKFVGKGSKAVPWLLDQGWRVLYSGYQTICVSDSSCS